MTNNLDISALLSAAQASEGNLSKLITTLGQLERAQDSAGQASLRLASVFSDLFDMVDTRAGASRSALSALLDLLSQSQNSSGYNIGGFNPSANRSTAGNFASSFASAFGASLQSAGSAGSVISGASSSSPVNVKIDLSSANATSLRQSESQLTALFARAIQRGAKGL